MKILTIIAAAALLTGCASVDCGKFYTPINLNARQEKSLLPPGKEQRVVPVANAGDASLEMFEQGLTTVGISSFTGPAVSVDNLKAQARKVGASVVLYQRDYSHQVSGAIPLITYQPGQTYTTYSSGALNGNVGGTQYYGNYSGSSTTTTPGTYSTQYVPYSTPIFNQVAMFMRPSKPGLGVFIKKSDLGVSVLAVRDDSTARAAGIRRGDDIIAIDGKRLDSREDFSDAVSSSYGREVQVVVMRGEKSLEFRVKMPEQ